MNRDPIIEVAALDVLAYKKDRATVIGRPFLVLMLNPICSCVLNKQLRWPEALTMRWQRRCGHGGQHRMLKYS